MSSGTRRLLAAVALGAVTLTQSGCGRPVHSAEAASSSGTPSSTQGAGQGAPSYITLPAELDRVLRDYERGWRAKDAAALAAIFAQDGFVLSDGRPPVRGRAAITQAYTGQGGALMLRALGASTADTAGWIVGTFARDSASPDVGKFVLALRRDRGGRWEISADIDNSIRR